MNEGLRRAPFVHRGGGKNTTPPGFSPTLPPMAGTHPYDAIKRFLQDRLSSAYQIIDMDEIDPVLEQEENPFLTLEEVVAQEEAVGIGDPSGLCVRETGTIIVHCFSPAPHASGATRSIGDSVRGLLRFQRFDGVRIVNVGAPDPGELMNSGVWSSASLLLTYEWDQHLAIPT